jgi:hypothetical protein
VRTRPQRNYGNQERINSLSSLRVGRYTEQVINRMRQGSGMASEANALGNSKDMQTEARL